MWYYSRPTTSLGEKIVTAIAVLFVPLLLFVLFIAYELVF